MTLSLAQIVDLDCVVSQRPLVLDLPSPNKYVRGIDAILRRVLYRWCRAGSLGITRPVTALEGTRWDANGLLRYRVELEGAARAVDFVSGASVPLTFDPVRGRLTIEGRISLIDGLTYALEVATADAPAAILAFGAQTA